MIYIDFLDTNEHEWHKFFRSADKGVELMSGKLSRSFWILGFKLIQMGMQRDGLNAKTPRITPRHRGNSFAVF